MKVRKLSISLWILLLATGLSAQQLWHPSQKIYAQQLVDKVFKKNPDLVSMGIHVTPPDSPDNVIIASNVPAKIGKVSDGPDMEVMRSGKPLVKLKGENVYDIVLPLYERSGKTIGLVGMNVRCKPGATETVALKRAQAITAELKQRIPSESRLFAKAQ